MNPYYTILKTPQFKYPNFEHFKGVGELDSFRMDHLKSKKVLHNNVELDFIRYKRWFLNPKFIFFNKYIETYLPELVPYSMHMGYQELCNDADSPAGAVMSPHLDGPRGNYVLQCVLDSGGDDVATSWHQEEGFPIYRPQGSGAEFYFEDHKYKVLDSVIFPTNTWAIMRTDVLHSVYKIKTIRKSVTLAFHANEQAYEDLVIKYGV